jgi:hypothetical protein
MAECTRSEIDQLVTGLCNRYDEATSGAVRERITPLLEDHDLSVGKVLTLIGAAFGDDPSNVRTVESIKTARIEPIEATLVGVVLRIVEHPEQNAREVWLSDGTGRIRVVLPAAAIAMDAVGDLRVIHHVGVKNDTERWAYGRDRTVVEKYGGGNKASC